MTVIEDVLAGRSEGCVVQGDCLEILPTLPDKCCVVVTDPPYGIGRDGSKMSTSSHGGRKAYEFAGWDSEIPPKAVFDQMFRVSTNQIIWGGNYFSQYLPSTMGWIVWDKGQRICSSDAELAFTSFDKALRVVEYNRVELQKDGAVHPTQKPVALMSWCMTNYMPQSAVVLDPFCGSGTTLVAAKRLGRRYIGIEINPEYVEIARNRLASTERPLFGTEALHG